MALPPLRAWWQRRYMGTSVCTASVCGDVVPVALDTDSVVVTTIKLDFDTPRCPRLLNRVRWVCRMLHWPVVLVEYRRTRHGWHVCVTVRRRVTPLQVVAVQAILGSDWRRETFNLVRARRLSRVPRYWRERFNVLYDHTPEDAT